MTTMVVYNRIKASLKKKVHVLNGIDFIFCYTMRKDDIVIRMVGSTRIIFNSYPNGEGIVTSLLVKESKSLD